VAVVGGVLAAAVLAVRAVLYSGAHGGDWRAVLAQSGAGGAALGIVVLAVIIPLAWRTYARRRTGHLEMVQAARPDATIIPAFTGRDSLKGLTSTGASGFRIPKYSVIVALAVLDDRVEVWVRGGERPWGTVQRRCLAVRVGMVTEPRWSRPGIRIDDGTSSVAFVPHYPRTDRATQFERALRALGEDPAIHVDS
jgi:hypothetical protein